MSKKRKTNNAKNQQHQRNQRQPFPSDAESAVPGQGWLVFPNRKGRPLDAHNIAARELKPACKAAGLPPIGWHTLRHTAVTLLQQAGATGAEAKAFAGHGSVGMTERYTHAEVERMRGSVEAIRFGETKVRRLM
ncbi:MAG: hypothetical protein E6Q97_37830 [Desulfurellales bacterium]|nr:MAG: hypothetical protein E6Q97_37830 [Desulfurellales bacterium]